MDSIYKSGAHNLQISLWEETDDCESDKQLQTRLIQQYTDLQRIKFAADQEKEIDYQIKAATAKLNAFGVATAIFDIN